MHAIADYLKAAITLPLQTVVRCVGAFTQRNKYGRQRKGLPRVGRRMWVDGSGHVDGRDYPWGGGLRSGMMGR